MMARASHGFALGLLLGLGLPAVVHANSIDATDCSDPVDFMTTFDVSDSICVTGDLDFTCRSGFITLPGVDIYVFPNGAGPFSAGPPVSLRDVLGGFGSFLNEPLWTGPLTPGVYDLYLDEHCDGTMSSDDLWVREAFTVGSLLMCELPAGAEPITPAGMSAMCRGACGPDCPGVGPPGTGVFAITPIETCTDTTSESMCVDDPGGACTHSSCSLRTVTCGSHQGCRTHDACYDGCTAMGSPPPSVCSVGTCDRECAQRYGMLCNSWRQGGGPFDVLMGFGEVTPVSGGAGACDGSC